MNQEEKHISKEDILKIVDKYGDQFNSEDRSLKDLINENEDERYKVKYGYMRTLILDMFNELRNL